MGDLDTGHEVRVLEARDEARDDVVARAVLVVELLHQEGHERRVFVVGRRQDVVGVEIADALENADHGAVELPLGELAETAAQQLQVLHRIDGVHGPLQRQVHIDVVEQRQRLIDDGATLGSGQLADGLEKVRYPDDGTEMRVRRLGGAHHAFGFRDGHGGVLPWPPRLRASPDGMGNITGLSRHSPR